MTQLDLFSRARVPSVSELGDGARVSRVPGWLNKPSKDIFDPVRQEIDWQQFLFERPNGTTVPMPRLEALHGDPELSYVYSGLTYTARPWTPIVARLRDRLHAATGIPFNAVFCNLYRDGRDSIGWHADDEERLGPQWPHDIAIASISLGASRIFHLRRKDDHALRLTWHLEHGDLLLMEGTTQRDWEHCIPKTKKLVGERINLTFRILLGE